MINKVILVGNVGRDPEVRNLDSGSKVASFPFATSESYKDREGQRVNTTEWHNIVIWRGLADVVERYVKKGSPLYLEGKIKTRAWDDKDGNKRYTTEIVVNELKMLGKANEQAGTTEAPGETGTPEGSDIAGGDDDLPF